MFDALNELSGWRAENLERVGSMGIGWWSEDSAPLTPPPDPPPSTTDTIIIGNGPSGLSASAFLAGWRPFYDHRHPHPNRNIHHRLSQHTTSLMDQDLSWVWNGEGEEEESGGSSGRSFSRFYDALVRPDADLGHDHPSSLSWEHSGLPVPHLCIGSGPPGGTWTHFSPHVYTLSLANWMNLPGVSIREWWERKSEKAGLGKWMTAMDFDMDKDRLPCILVSAYFQAYPKLTGITDNLLSYTTVTEVKRLEADEQTGYRWEVRAENKAQGSWTIRARNLIMGTGVGLPKELGVAEERSCPNILYSLGELESRLAEMASRQLDRPILVIGHGLTAADAVFFSLVKQLPVPVHHIFRIPAKEIRYTTLGRLSSSKYPDYHLVSRLIQGKATDPFYIPFPSSNVRAFKETYDGSWLAEVERSNGEVEEMEFSLAVINVGFQGGLPSVQSVGGGVDLGLRDPKSPPDSKKNILPVQPNSYRSPSQEGLYVVGPLAGDNFVRHLVGGSFAAAKDILSHS